MWKAVEKKFEHYPAQMKVATKMINLGLRIDESGKIYCSDLKIGYKALAEATEVDRRAIKSTINTIMNDEELSIIFKNIEPAGSSLKKIAKNIGLSAVEIVVGSESEGILSKIADLFVKKGINIRQAYAKDDRLSNPTLTIIADGKVPSEILDDILKIEGVLRLLIY